MINIFNILVVEDDKNTRRLMSEILLGKGYNPILAENGLVALAMMGKHYVDLVIADIMMPAMDGYALTKALRQANYNLPILMVTAKEASADMKKGFLVGTDDYMVKPIDEEEMLLRIAALLRRSKIANEHRLTIGDVVLDYKSLTITGPGEPLALPQKEFYLLYKLLSYPNQIFTRRQLMDEIWSMDSESDERTVDVHINRLRSRLETYSQFEIVTVRGLGYKAVKKL